MKLRAFLFRLSSKKRFFINQLETQTGNSKLNLIFKCLNTFCNAHFHSFRKKNNSYLVSNKLYYCLGNSSGKKMVAGFDHRNVNRGIPKRGIASDTWGRVSVTMLWKTVRERRIVTPEKVRKLNLYLRI